MALQVEPIVNLYEYLQLKGLIDTKLSEKERTAIEQLEQGKVSFEWFDVVDIFNVKNTFNILSRDIISDSGNTPYLSASKENNAVSTYISYDQRFLDKGNCIFIGGKTFVVTYQAQDFFSNDSHNLCLHLKNKEIATKLIQLFMKTCLEKGLGHKYSWGNSISSKKIQSDKLLLPIKDNIIDYPYMEILMSALQKGVLKEVMFWIKTQYGDLKINL
ncbi:restriction endonuclease subunit S [Mannheimia cairinae]